MANNTPDMSQVVDLFGVAEIRDWVKANFLKKSDAEGMMASKIKITFGADFEGQQYTITGGANESYTGTVPASLIVEQTIKTLNTTYTVTCATAEGTSYDREIVVGNFYGIYPGEVYSFRAFIACTADAGATITAVCGAKTYSGVADSKGAFTFTVGMVGTYSLTATLNGDTTAPVTVDVSTAEETYTCKLPSLFLNIVPWATGTDEEIAAMVAALDAGTLSIEDTGWAVGDERTVSLSAMAKTGVGESHVAQDVTLVLMDSGHFELAEATASGRTTDHFVVGLKHFLSNGTTGEWGYMNSSNTNSGSWEGCARRKWCNEVFRAAIPEALRACFKQFKTVTAETYNGSTLKTSLDYFALFAEKEIFGSRSYSNTTEANALTQIEWYKTSGNRVKKAGNGSGSANAWWERSPASGNSGMFCCVNSNGNANYDSAIITTGLAPFGCI